MTTNAGQTLALLYQQLADTDTAGPARIDLHIHSTHSDGEYTPARILDEVELAGIPAFAVTDHDTTSAVPELLALMRERRSECRLIPGVEITCTWDARETHVLGYGIDLDDEPLQAILARVRAGRQTRFLAMAGLLIEWGVRLRPGLAEKVAAETSAPGRRNLADLLVRESLIGTVSEAFRRWLTQPAVREIPKVRVPIAEALAAIRDAGGLSSLAHPSKHFNSEVLRDLRSMGLRGLECEYPFVKRASRTNRLREIAGELGLLVTGGSDCHGPEPAARRIGTCGLTADDWQRLGL